MPRVRGCGTTNSSVISQGDCTRYGGSRSIIEYLSVLCEQNKANENFYWCVKRALRSIKKYAGKITCYNDAIKVPYVGDVIATKISVFLKKNPQALNEGNYDDANANGNMLNAGDAEEVLEVDCEALAVNGAIGKKRKRRERKRNDHGDGNNVELEEGAGLMNDVEQSVKKRRHSTKEYRPRYRSGGYAILIALYRAEEDRGEYSMRKADLVHDAQPYADEPMLVETGRLYGGGIGDDKENKNRYYSAWSSMKTLVAKALVARGSNPTRYSLSGTGRKLAGDLWLQNVAAERRTVTQYNPAGRDVLDKVKEWEMVCPLKSAPSCSSRLKENAAAARTRKKKPGEHPTDMSHDNCISSVDRSGTGVKYAAAGPQNDEEVDVHVNIVEKAVAEGYDLMIASRTLEFILAIAKGRQRRKIVLQKTLLDILRRKRLEDQQSRGPLRIENAVSAVKRNEMAHARQEPATRDGAIDTFTMRTSTLVEKGTNSSHQSAEDGVCVSLIDDTASLGATRAKEHRLASRDIVVIDDVHPSNLKKLGTEAMVIKQIQSMSTGKMKTCEIVLLLDNHEIYGAGSHSREAFFKTIQRQAQVQGIRVESRVLAVGDALCIARALDTGEEYVLDFIIERKTWSDYRASILDGRFDKQTYAMKTCNIPNRIFLVEGCVDAFLQCPSTTDGGGSVNGRAVSEAALRKKLVELSVNDGFFVNYVRNMAETTAFYLSIVKRLIQKYCEVSMDELRGKKKEFKAWSRRCEEVNSQKKMTIGQLFKLQLTCIPGLGTIRVDQLTRNNFCSFADLWNAYKHCGGEADKENMLNRCLVKTSGRAHMKLSRMVYQLVNSPRYPTMPVRH